MERVPSPDIMQGGGKREERGRERETETDRHNSNWDDTIKSLSSELTKHPKKRRQ